MDPDLSSGLPLCPSPLSVDLGYDLALDALPFSSSGIDDVLMRIPSIDALLPLDEPIDLSPSFNHSPSIPSEGSRANALNPMPYTASLMIDNEHLDRTGGPALQGELLECPELRFHRLIESRERREMARTRSRSSGDDSDPERLMRDIRRSGRLVGSIGKRKATDKAPQVEGSTEEKKEKSGGGASDFDCNICFEVSKEPVVTCCGHMFCWPCLYQWLHVHCDYKECPVCKGKLNDNSVVPIYGRGSSEAREDKNGEDGHQSLKIPPRPQANRAESLRQQMQNPTLRRSESRSESWFREVQELFNELPERFRFFPREVRRNNQPIPPVAPTSHPRQTLRSPAHGNAQIVNAERNSNSSRRREQPVTITGSEDLRDPVPSPSQTSTSSSTMAMIQGEYAAPNASWEANRRGGTSMVLRSRTRSRSRTSSLLDVNEPAPHLHQRRRMN